VRLQLPDTISRHTHSNSFVVMPEQRNVQGTLFGGIVVAEAFELAYYAAKYFVRGRPFAPIAMDEAIFLQPIAPGDMVNMKASVVHSEASVFRVRVVVHLVDPMDPERWPSRTNSASFVFAAPHDFSASVVPETYPQMLMHVHASRQAAEQPPCPNMLETLHEYLHKNEEKKKVLITDPGNHDGVTT